MSEKRPSRAKSPSTARKPRRRTADKGVAAESGDSVFDPGKAADGKRVSPALQDEAQGAVSPGRRRSVVPAKAAALDARQINLALQGGGLTVPTRGACSISFWRTGGSASTRFAGRAPVR